MSVKARMDNGEEGYAIVLAILMLAILMIAGVLASNTTITDLSAARNQIISSQNMAAADSAAMMAVRILEYEKNSKELDPVTSSWGWIKDESKTDDYLAAAKWGTTDLKGATPTSISDYLDKISPRFGKENAKVMYRVIGWNATRGASLGAYAETLRECYVRGVYYSPSSGIYSVEMGYKKRF